MTGFQNNSQSFNSNPIEMNMKYQELSRAYNPLMNQDFVEYNHIVDDILQISPPYITDSAYAPKYLAPEAKPNDQNASANNIQFYGTGNKLEMKREAKYIEKMPMNNFSKIMHDKGLLPGFNKSSSFMSFNEYQPQHSGSNQLDFMKQSSSRIGDHKNIHQQYSLLLDDKNSNDIMTSLHNIYNMDNEEAPNQPPKLKIDSLFRKDSIFKNNQNSNMFLIKPEVVKPSSMLEFRQIPSGISNKSFDFDQKSKEVDKDVPTGFNKAYEFLKQNLGQKNKFLKINMEDLNKEEDDDN